MIPEIESERGFDYRDEDLLRKIRYGRRILIMDDQMFNIYALKIMLRCFTIIEPDDVSDIALNGQEAIKKVVQNISNNQGSHCDYSIIFMDCNMPFIDGYEAT